MPLSLNERRTLVLQLWTALATPCSGNKTLSSKVKRRVFPSFSTAVWLQYLMLMFPLSQVMNFM